MGSVSGCGAFLHAESIISEWSFSIQFWEVVPVGGCSQYVEIRQDGKRQDFKIASCCRHCWNRLCFIGRSKSWNDQVWCPFMTRARRWWLDRQRHELLVKKKVTKLSMQLIDGCHAQWSDVVQSFLICDLWCLVIRPFHFMAPSPKGLQVNSVPETQRAVFGAELHYLGSPCCTA